MKTIRQKLLLWLLGGTLLYALVGGVLLFTQISTETNELYDDQLMQIAQSVPMSMMSIPSAGDNSKFHENFSLQVWDLDGKLIYASNYSVQIPVHKINGFQTVEFNKIAWRIFVRRTQDYIVQAAQPVYERDILVGEMAFRCLIPFIVLMPLLILLIWGAVNKCLMPLNMLANNVRSRSPDDLHPVSTAGISPELVPLCESLNDLLKRLNYSTSLQKEFIADAAHELRSPLTALKLQIQLVEMATDSDQRDVAISKVHERIDRATNLVHQLLTLARNEPGSNDRPQVPINLKSVAEQTVIDNYQLAAAKKIDLSFSWEGASFDILGNSDDVRVLMSNLLSNAIRYTSINGVIELALINKNEKIIFRVSDNGPGIPSYEYSRVFNRFYRCEHTAAWGSGLGLSIAKNIVDKHLASIQLQPTSADKGLTVVVSFPILLPLI
ncbi:ATP-binding protein [Undibacterium sp. RuTC16W]|uniref:ATP-binding protein n=1 Tax=Undibacterium sp. RuTC16W TaxID=3413048 RepID=UPI003BF3A711